MAAHHAPRLFKAVGVEPPPPEIDPNQPFDFTAPQVHSAIVG